jgi:acyl-coenzyme A thioesterase PaaI-like protein
MSDAVSHGGFAAATAVTPSGPGAFAAVVRPGWDIGGNANGGYLLAIAARALRAATGRPDPVTVTAHYLSPGKPGPVDITTRVVKAGRRFSHATALLDAGGRPLLSVLGTFGDLGEDHDDLFVDGAPPTLPPPEACMLLGTSDTFPPPFMGKVELRVHPDDMGFATGNPSGVPRVTGWFRLLDDEPVDTLALLCALDAFPPTIFNADLPVGWVPTIELTAHVRARPAPGWLRCRFTTRYVTGGFLEEDGEIWDVRGRLVAQSRQLALVPLAPDDS